MRSAVDDVADIFAALETSSPADVVQAVLAAARENLGVELAFVAETRGDQHIVRFTDGSAEPLGVAVDQRRRLEETVCGLVLAGDLPRVIADTHAHPGTAGYPFRSYAGAPITFSDGSTFGLLCAVSAPPRRVRASHVGVLRTLADIIGRQLEGQQHRWSEHCARLLDVARALENQQPSIVHQPMVDLRTGQTVGVEALARFGCEPVHPPDRWFRDAWTVGYGADLELCAVERALDTISSLPEDCFLSVNVSPKLPHLSEFMDLVQRYPLRRVVIELTEHSRLGDPRELRHALQEARDLGLRVAVDDAGAGFAGLSRILDLEPDFIKLDAGLVRFVDSDPQRASLAEALVMFAAASGCTIVAEGVEHQRQADTLMSLGINLAQGFLFGRPAPPDA